MPIVPKNMIATKNNRKDFSIDKDFRSVTLDI
jgi:hypothetical protein